MTTLLFMWIKGEALDDAHHFMGEALDDERGGT